MKRFNIIDGYSYVFRAYYALPPLTNQKNEPVGAVFGFCKMLLSLLEDRKDEPFLVVLDTGHPNFRHHLYKEYKANRKEAPEDLKSQFPKIREACIALNLPHAEKDGFEADDLIAAYAQHAESEGYDVSIVSADKDLMQLVDKNISMLDPIKGKKITTPEVIEKFGVPPVQVKDVLALMGDTSDNIPGVMGVGPKNAKDLIVEYGSIENMYDNIDAMKPSKRKENLIACKEDAFLSKKLVTLDHEAPIELDVHDLEVMPNFETANIYLEEQGFKSLIPTYKNLFQHKVVSKIKDVGIAQIIEKCTLDLYIENDNIRVDDMIAKLDDEALQTLKPLLEDTGITKYVDVIKPFLQKCRNNNIKLESYHGIDVISYVLGKSGQLNDIIKDSSAFSYFYVDRPFTEVLLDMEHDGIKIDTHYFNKFELELEKEIDDLEKEIYVSAGVVFNIGSPKQLSEVLYEKLGLPKTRKGKSGVYSTDVDVLMNLKDHKVVQLLLRYRTLTKLLSTYVKPLLDKQVKGVVNTTYGQTNTQTGRLTSINPNLQNIPTKTEEGNKIRHGFIPRYDHLISFDYSQIELRLVAHYSGEEKLIEAYRANKDIHAQTALEMFGEVNEDTRRHAKVINFGMLYGMSAQGLANDLGISMLQGQKLIDQYFERYPKIKEYIDNQIHQAQKHGFIETIFARKIYIKDINSKNVSLANYAQRQSMNFPLQGSTADIIKLAMVKIQEWLRNEGLQSKMILQIHDELVFDVVEAEKDKLIEKVGMLMSDVCDKLIVPLVVNVNVGKNWGEL